MTELLQAECKPEEPETIVCRICEEEIPANLLKEHSKFCVIANQWDMVYINVVSLTSFRLPYLMMTNYKRLSMS